MPASALQLTAISVSSSGAFSTRFSLQVFRKINHLQANPRLLSTQHPSPSKWNCGKWGQDLALWYCEDMWRQKNRSDLLWFHHVPSRPLLTSDLPVTWAVQKKPRLMVGEHFMSMGLSTIKYLLLKYQGGSARSSAKVPGHSRVPRWPIAPLPRGRHPPAGSRHGWRGSSDESLDWKAAVHDSWLAKNYGYTWLYMTNCIFYSMCWQFVYSIVCVKKRTWSYMFHGCWWSN